MSGKSFSIVWLFLAFAVMFLFTTGCAQRESSEGRNALSTSENSHRVTVIQDLLKPADNRKFTFQSVFFDFSEQKGISPLVGSWSKPERDGERSFQWITGHEAGLLLPLAVKDDFMLEFEARTVTTEGERQKLTVMVNGVQAAESFMISRWHRYRIKIPRPLVRKGVNRIMFKFTVATRQRTGDIRRLSACFDSLLISRGASIHREKITHIPNWWDYYGSLSSDYLTLRPGVHFLRTVVVPEAGSLKLEAAKEQSGKGNPRITVQLNSLSGSVLWQKTVSLKTPYLRNLQAYSGRVVSLEMYLQSGSELTLAKGTLTGKTTEIVDVQGLKRIVKKNNRYGGVTIVGMDGLSWDILMPLIDNGLLPNLKKLVEQGFAAPLKTLFPTKSPTLWTSIATGKTPEKHGIRDFIKWDGKRQIITPMTADNRTAKFVWNILSDVEKKVMVVGWWPSWPAEPVNGTLVTNERGGSKVKRQTWPPELFSRLKRFYAPREVPYRRFLNGTYDPVKGKVGNYQLQDYEKAFIQRQLTRAYVRDTKYADIALYLLQQEKADFRAIYFNGTDPVSHVFYKYFRPEGFKVSETQKEVLGSAVPNMYRYLDELLGKLMKYLPKNTDIIICSDHGFAPYHQQDVSINTEQLLLDCGFLKYKENSKKVDFARTSVYRGPGFSNDLWQKVVVNKKVVRNPLKKQEVLLSLRQCLEKQVLTTSGESFISVNLEKGTQYDASFSIDRNKIDSPFIMVKGRRRKTSRYMTRKHISGTHAFGPDGVLVLSGPSFRKGRLSRQRDGYELSIPFTKPRITDITPTVLYLYGLPTAKDMDGRILYEALADEPRIPGYAVTSYDRIGKPLELLKGHISEQEGKRYQKELEALGYIQ